VAKHGRAWPTGPASFRLRATAQASATAQALLIAPARAGAAFSGRANFLLGAIAQASPTVRIGPTWGLTAPELVEAAFRRAG